MKKTFLLNYSNLTACSFAVILCFTVSCQEDNPVSPFKDAVVSAKKETTPREKADVAIAWYKLQLKMILNANPAYSPTVLGRIFGYEGIALYESVRHGNKNSVSLSSTLYQMPAMPSKENNVGYSWPACANTTIATIVRTMYPNLTAQNRVSIDSLENKFNNELKPGVESTVFKRSQDFGNAIANAILSWSTTDNDNQSNVGYVPPVFDGAWIPTPPLFAPALAPYLGSARPLLPEDVTGVSPPPAFAYSEDPDSDFYKMAKDLYDVSQTLTTEQKNIALFWNDVGVKKGFTPPGHSVSILTQILEKENSSLDFAAGAYAKLGIALRDAMIMVWRSKFTYNLIRPVSYIRKVIDANWLPLLGTPPHPEYPAAHAYVTGAAMQALTGIFGEDYSFTDNTYNFLGYAPRTFSSLNDAGTESGMSRRFGGIHYLPSIEVGLVGGRAVGLKINSIQLSTE